MGTFDGIFPHNPDTVDTYPKTGLLGTVINTRDPDDGLYKDFIYLKNDHDTTATAVGDVMIHQSGDTVRGHAEVSTGAVSAAVVYGISRVIVAAQSAGWFIRRGMAEVDLEGAVSALDPLIPAATAGEADAGSAGDDNFGYAIDGGTDTVATCYVDCRG